MSEADLQAQVEDLGAKVRELKASKASKADIDAAVGALLAAKAKFKQVTGRDAAPTAPANGGKTKTVAEEAGATATTADGESKSAQKKAKKAAEKAAKDTAKALERAAKVQAEGGEKNQCDDELDEHEYFAQRSIRVAELKQKGPQPYPHKFHVSISLQDVIAQFDTPALKDGARADQEVRVAGRIFSVRASGKNLVFYDIRGEGVKVQIMATAA